MMIKTSVQILLKKKLFNPDVPFKEPSGYIKPRDIT